MSGKVFYSCMFRIRSECLHIVPTIFFLLKNWWYELWAVFCQWNSDSGVSSFCFSSVGSDFFCEISHNFFFQFSFNFTVISRYTYHTHDNQIEHLLDCVKCIRFFDCILSFVCFIFYFLWSWVRCFFFLNQTVWIEAVNNTKYSYTLTQIQWEIPHKSTTRIQRVTHTQQFKSTRKYVHLFSTHSIFHIFFLLLFCIQF